ncbi:MBL fold metallo-hydrolase [Paenibacillus sediminis]|uniref:L-ascorbate metabolism protein UlaG (Beta-lactamase superfamily) n=1 Tax=Paenibacillus sediminis TaxID=664909 RepID=A0ABS4H139_9BACL|nr:MBL fold metallo-hydrolase [Paenibacillus sediminis]MBP1936243.1 L-ascorbate metabolism protein UlaG (beta-lactamase superfamily) [Paenibacillus sediminis]
MLVLISVIVGVIIAAVLFMKLYPTFGQKPSKEKVKTYNKLENFANGKFVNQITTSSMDNNFSTTLSLLKEYIKGNPNSKPHGSIPIERPGTAFHKDDKTKITWFGHSALLLEMEGKILLLDPMLGKSPSPFPFVGSGRYSKVLPIEIEELPLIDAVIYSHDHYDHLDYESVLKLKDKVNQFIVPLGVGSHLERWGIESTRIKECNWWDEFEFSGLTFVSTPARHFSGRSLLDRNSTLWCSWVIIGQHTKIYYSADSGYGPHFKQIGQKYGPFDMTLMECGQYDKRWANIHMFPEQTVQAHLDVKGKVMIPVHWAAFTLSFHDWTDPIERVLKAAKERGVAISTPKIGEKVIVGSSEYPTSTWWRLAD